MNVDAEVGGHLREGGGEPGRPAVLERFHGPDWTSSTDASMSFFP